MSTHLGPKEEVAVCRLPVTPCAAHRLHVALEAGGQAQVQHSPHIRPVQPHPKGHRGHHHAQPALHEGPLHPPPLSAAQASVVGLSHSLQSSACREDQGGQVGHVPGARLRGAGLPCLTMGPWVPGLAQAGAQQGGDTLCVLSPVAVDDDGVQSPETVTPQQRHQCLWGRGSLQSTGRQGHRQAHACTLTWSGSLSEDTERCRLAGMVAGPLSTDSSVTPRCQATSRAVLRVAVAVRPKKQWTPVRSRSVCEGAVSQHHPPALHTVPPAQAHLTGMQRTPGWSCGVCEGAVSQRHPPALHASPPAQAHLTDTQVTGPEVVGPLRETVGLVEAGKGDRRQLREEGASTGPDQRLWR